MWNVLFEKDIIQILHDSCRCRCSTEYNTYVCQIILRSSANQQVPTRYRGEKKINHVTWESWRQLGKRGPLSSDLNKMA